MDSTHIHLLLNHFPIIGTLIATILLAWAVFRNNTSIRSAGYSLLIAMALVAIPVYLTGEPAEESVEDLPGVSESHIEQHEDAAKSALIAMEVTGVLALAGLIAARKGHAQSNTLGLATLGAAVVTCALMGYTGNLGGQIHHQEIRGTGAGTGPTEQMHESGLAPTSSDSSKSKNAVEDDD